MMIILLWFHIHIHLYHLVPGLVASLPACVCMEQPRDGSISFNFCLSICFSLQARNLAASAHLLHIIFNVNVIVCKSVSVLFSDRLCSVRFALVRAVVDKAHFHFISRLFNCPNEMTL